MKWISHTLLIFLFLSKLCFAAQTNKSFNLSANETKVLSISHTGKHLSWAIYVEDKLIEQNKSIIPFYANELIVIGPYDNARNITLVINDTPFEQTTSSINLIPAPLDEEGISDLIKEKTYLSELSRNLAKKDDVDLTKLPIKPKSDNLLVNNYSIENSAYLYFKANQFATADSLFNQLFVPQDRLVRLQCFYLQRLIDGGLNFDNKQLSAMGLLAGNIVEFARNSGEIVSEPNHNMSVTAYKKLCGVTFDQIGQQGQLIRQQSHATQINLISDADFLLNTMRLFTPRENDELMASMFDALWFLHNYLDEHSIAENYARQAISAVETLPDSKGWLASLYSMISSSLVRQGFYAEAQRFLTLGLGISELDNQELTSVLLYNKGVFYIDTGEYYSAHSFLQRALDTSSQGVGHFQPSKKPCSKPEQNIRAIARAVLKIGVVYRLQGDLAAAQLYYNCAAIVLSESNSYNQFNLHIENARVALMSRQFYLAIEKSNLVLADKRARLPQRIDAELIVLEAQLALDQKQVNDTEKRLASYFGANSFFSSDFIKQDSSLFFLKQIEALRLMVELSGKRDQREWVEQFSRKAISLIKSKQSTLVNPQAWKGTLHRFIETYINTYKKNIYTNTQEVKTLFGVIETLYANDIVNERAIHAAAYNIEEGNKELKKRFHHWIDTEKKHLLRSSDTMATALQKIEAAKDAYQSFKVLPPKEDELQGKTILSAQELQALIPKNEALIRYFISEKLSFAIVFSKHSLFAFQLTSKDEIEVQVQLILKRMQSGKPFSMTPNESRSLLPIDYLLTNNVNKLVIIPDGVLHKFPFALLNIEQRNHRYKPLISNIETVIAFSANSYYQQARKVNKVGHSAPLLSIFANSVARKATAAEPINMAMRNMPNESRSASLPNTLIEAQAIADTFKNKQVNLGVGLNATNAFLLAEKTRSSSILHIATHGYFNHEFPELVGLETTSIDKMGRGHSDFLSHSRLLSASFDSQLVVISGCETMLGENFKGSGMRSMSRGFITQGAGSVIGTYWPVQDKATSKFMQTFYLELLNNNGNSVKALQKTQRRFASYGRYRHPKYWAGFVLTVANRKDETIDLN